MTPSDAVGSEHDMICVSTIWLVRRLPYYFTAWGPAWRPGRQDVVQMAEG